MRVVFIVIFCFVNAIIMVGHPMPNSIIKLNVGDQLNLKIQIPLDEFAIAFKQNINENSLIEDLTPYIFKKHKFHNTANNRKITTWKYLVYIVFRFLC